MTDTSVTPTPRATVCDVDGCHALIPATLDDRREHRRGHAHDRKVIDALRAANKDLNAKIAELTRRLSGVENDVAHIEIPEQVEPLAIVATDDLEPLDEDDLDDDYATESTYADDDYVEPATAAVSPVQPAIDRDDDLGPYNTSTRP